jgi:hypothetical protein
MNDYAETYNVGISYYDDNVIATREEIEDLLGDPSYRTNDLDSRVQYEWEATFIKDERKVFFRLYDWDEHRHIGFDEKIEWHIGCKGKYEGLLAKEYMEMMLKRQRENPSRV